MSKSLKNLTPLEQRLGVSWARNERVAKLFESDEVKNIANVVSEDRKHGPVYPAQQDVFKAFRETPFSTVRVVWLGQDPYNKPEGQATGLAMDCGVHRSPTIDKLYEVYDEEYPSNFNTDLIDGKLIRWAHQGVLLINSALTVRHDAAGSHLDIWQPFTKEILNILMYDQNPKVFVGLGKPAQQMLGNVPGPHSLLKYEHPVYASYQMRKWDAVGIFHKINELLKFHGRPQIDW